MKRKTNKKPVQKRQKPFKGIFLLKGKEYHLTDSTLRFNRDNYLAIAELANPFLAQEFKVIANKLRAEYIKEVKSFSGLDQDIKVLLTTNADALHNARLEEEKLKFKIKRATDDKFWKTLLNALLKETIPEKDFDLYDPEFINFVTELTDGFFLGKALLTTKSLK